MSVRDDLRALVQVQQHELELVRIGGEIAAIASRRVALQAQIADAEAVVKQAEQDVDAAQVEAKRLDTTTMAFISLRFLLAASEVSVIQWRPEMKITHRTSRDVAIRRWIAIFGLYWFLATTAMVPVAAAVQRAQAQHLDIAARVASGGSFVDRISWIPMNPAETMTRQVQESPIIVVGQAVANDSRVSPSGRGIVMHHEVFVLEVLKGDVNEGDTLAVVVPGGRVEFDDGSFAQWNLVGMAWPEPGKRYVWFLERARQYHIADYDQERELYEPASGPLGIWVLDEPPGIVAPLGELFSALAMEIVPQQLKPAEFINMIRDSAHRVSTLAEVTANHESQTMALAGRQLDASRALRGAWAGRGRGDGSKSASLLTEPDDIVTMFHARTYATVNIPQSVEEQVQRSACRADAVVIGTAATRGSFLADDAQYVISEYKLQVTRSLVGSIRPGSVVSYFRPGGTVNIDGRIIRVVNERFPELELGTRYAVFLRKLPGETNAYAVVSGEGSTWGVDAIEMGDLAVGRSPWSLKELEEGVEIGRVLGAIRSGACQ